MLQDALRIFTLSQKLNWPSKRNCNILYFGSCFCSDLSSKNFSWRCLWNTTYECHPSQFFERCNLQISRKMSNYKICTQRNHSHVINWPNKLYCTQTIFSIFILWVTEKNQTNFWSFSYLISNKLLNLFFSQRTVGWANNIGNWNLTSLFIGISIEWKLHKCDFPYNR